MKKKYWNIRNWSNETITYMYILVVDHSQKCRNNLNIEQCFQNMRIQTYFTSYIEHDERRTEDVNL